MRRFINILFSPIGRSENPAAIRRVADLARQNGARLTLFGTVPEAPKRHLLRHHPELDAAIESAERLEIADRLKRWADAADDLEADIDVRVGNPALAIIGRVLAGGYDLVVVTSDEDREDRATIRRLLRKCPCPVWVIRPTRAKIQRVMVAVNPEPDEAALNVTLLELGAGMHQLHGGELHVASAWELYGEATMRSSAFASAPAEVIESYLRAERDDRVRAIDDLIAASSAPAAPWQIQVAKGRPGTVVPELVSHHRINLLVMGTLARSGISGLVMGNTAEQVLDHVGCSVIAVKPADFSTPLEL